MYVCLDIDDAAAAVVSFVCLRSRVLFVYVNVIICRIYIYEHIYVCIYTYTYKYMFIRISWHS